MNNIFRVLSCSLALVIPSSLAVSAAPKPSTVYPGAAWQADARGLPPQVRRRVDEFVHALDTTGLMVVQHGRVVYQYGDTKVLSYSASTRKSVLAMLYGPYVANGTIRLDQTLKDLGMSDVGGLLPLEERATVLDLITARSGVYHPASYPGDDLDSAPGRGSQKPGTYWLYSNWDFNAAGAAFEKMTGKNIYDALRDGLAIPIGMQDFRRERQHKDGDLTRSQYLAYPMWFSTRDMARIAYLMLRHGRWWGRQVIPAEWVKRTTSVVTPRRRLNPVWRREGPFGYGYLWWVWDEPSPAGPFQGAYTSWGVRGQYFTVLPKLDMVIAHKTIPVNRNVPLGSYLRLLDRIVGKIPASELILPVLWRKGEGAAMARYQGLKSQPGNYIVSESDLYAAGLGLLRRGRVDRSVQVLSLNARLYPDSVFTLIALSRSQSIAGKTTLALKTVRKALALQPRNPDARVQLARLGALVDGHTAIKLPPNRIRLLTGLYQSEDTRYRVESRPGGLSICAYRDGDLSEEWEAFPEKGGRFFIPANGTLLRFEEGAGGVVEAMEGASGQETWYALRGGSPMTMTKLASPALWTKEIETVMRLGDVPGLSVAVIRNGKIVWKRPFGEMNAIKDGKTDGPVRDDTLFPAASFSKTVFAYIVLRLADRGTLDLDRPLYHYLPNPRMENDARYKRITARMVLTHSSGLPNWGGTPLSILFSPGEHFNYSGEGFMYLQAVVEKLMGQSLESLARKEVFEPLQMTRSTYTWSPGLASNLVSGKLATDYSVIVRDPNARAADSLLTTPEEYAKFVLAIINGTGLKPETAARMLTPQIRAPRWKFGPSDQIPKKELPAGIFWGLGWGLEEGSAGPYIWHTGDNEAFRCFVIASRPKQEGVVYFANSQGGLSIASALVSAILGGKHPSLEWIDYDSYDSPKAVTRRELIRVFERSGTEAGLARYRERRKRSPVVVDEGFTRELGYYLRNHGAMDAAIGIFRENVRNYSQSVNTLDALCWAYLLADRIEPGLESNVEALALEPDSAIRQARIVWLREYLRVRKEPVRIRVETLPHYVGDYKEGRVTFKDHTLYFQDAATGKDHPLMPLSEDTFAIEGDVSRHLSFMKDERSQNDRILVSMMPGW